MAELTGYRDLDHTEASQINQIKMAENQLATMVTELEARAKLSPDPIAAGRWAALARTHLEMGFMFLVKSVARPLGGLGRKP